jgi:tRNA(Ile)-lysidine synthase
MNHGTKLVSDYLTDRKVSLFDKQKQLVAIDTTTQKIVWLVGREIDNHYRITQSTKRILRITCQ